MNTCKTMARFLGLLFLCAVLMPGCGGGGGGGGGGATVDRTAETATLKAMVNRFLQAVQSSDPQAENFCSQRFLVAGSMPVLQIHLPTGGLSNPASTTWEFTVNTNEIVYLTPDLALVTASCDQVDGYRVVLKFTLMRESGVWFIDAIEVTNTPITVTLPAPTITAVSPSSGVNTSSLTNTTITGTGFQTNATVQLTRTGQPSVSATSISVAAAGTSLTCTLPLTGLQVGTWNIVVTNPDGQSVTGTNFLTVTAPVPLPAPTISSIEPATAGNGSPVENAFVAGTSFQNGATVQLTRTGQNPVSATSVVVAANGTSITCTLPLTGLQLGTWNIVVTNPDGQTVTGDNLLTVTDPLPPPLVSDYNPTNANNDANRDNVIIMGLNFQDGATVQLVCPEPHIVTATNVVVSNGGSMITCTLPLAGVHPGDWDVVVTNPDGQSGTGPAPFTVTLPPPTISQVTALTDLNSDTYNDVTIVGTGFQTGATITLNPSAPNPVNLVNVTVSGGGTTVTGLVVFPLAGTWDVLLTNPDGQSVTGTVNFDSPP